MGIEYSEDKHARTRNSVRRMVAEVKGYLNSVVYAILGIIKSFGLSTSGLVMKRMQDYIKAGKEVFPKSIEKRLKNGLILTRGLKISHKGKDIIYTKTKHKNIFVTLF